MAEGKRKPAAVIRMVVLLLILGTIAVFAYRRATRREDYTGGNIQTTGTLEAVHVQLGFKIAGRLAAVPVSEGEVVKAGQVIGRLETDDLAVQVDAAQAALETAQAALTEARANREKAAQDLERIRELLRGDASTRQQLDAVEAASRVADAQVQAATARVHQAQSDLDRARLQMSYAELRTPEAGIVSEKIHRAGEMILIGTPVVTVAQLDTIKVHAPVDETRIGAVRPGDPVRVKVYTFDRKTFDGVVTDIQPSGEFATRKDWGAQRRDIRTFTVTARVPNPELLLKDGMTAEVEIQVAPEVQKIARGKP